jgi:hypothetical protein
MKLSVLGISLGCALGTMCLAPGAQAIENHVQSTPTDVFFFGAGFTPPPSEFGTFGVREAFNNSASIGPNGSKPNPQAKTTVSVTTPSWVYMTKYRILGANYGFVVVQPMFIMNGSLRGSIPVGPGFSIPINQAGHVTGFGNTQIYPILLQWMDMPHLAINASVAVQLPDGKYDKTALLNPSTNYWTFSPNFALTYITNYGQEFSTYQEVDFNTANTATHYKSGTEYKMDWAIGQHLGNFTVGPAGSYYQQLQNDSGSGTLAPGANPLAARVFSAGLAFNYVPRDKPFAIFGSFMEEFGAENHSQGLAASLRVAYTF